VRISSAIQAGEWISVELKSNNTALIIDCATGADGVENIYVTAAAAQITGEILADGGIVWVHVLVE
jgi:hypothetical protein